MNPQLTTFEGDLIPLGVETMLLCFSYTPIFSILCATLKYLLKVVCYLPKLNTIKMNLSGLLKERFDHFLKVPILENLVIEAS